MSVYQFVAGTDIACIGLWDRKWSDPSIREKSVSKFLKRLPLDAEQKRVFYIKTEGDGQSSVEIHVNEDFTPDNKYKKTGDIYSIGIKSGEAIFDGLESYGSNYDYKNILNLDNGSYTVELYELIDPEDEDYKISQLEPSKKPHIIERFVFPVFLILVFSIYLFFQTKYIIASILFLFSLVFSVVLGTIQKQERFTLPKNYKAEIKVPYLIICMKKTDDTSIQGGYVSLSE
jgi:hypothetical protein